MFVIGVPVKRWIPFPPRCARTYSDRKCRLIDRSDEDVLRPRRRVFVLMGGFLNSCASSTKIVSIPRSSNVIAPSRDDRFAILAMFAMMRSRIFTICLAVTLRTFFMASGSSISATVRATPSSFAALMAASSSSAISRAASASSVLRDSASRSISECGMTIASQSSFAIRRMVVSISSGARLST